MRKNFGITIFVLLALFAVIAGGGCGGGGSGSTAEEPGVLLGTLNGRLAPYLREALNSLGGVVLLSGSEGLNANLPQLRASFDQGQAIALVSADTGDVNVLLNALSIDVASPKTQDEREFDLFAVRKKNGKHHFFVTLHHEEDTPGSATKRTITIIGPEDNPTSVDVTEEPVKKKQRPGQRHHPSWARPELRCVEQRAEDSGGGDEGEDGRQHVLGTSGPGRGLRVGY